MAVYVESILWYLFFIDCILYNILSWTKGTKIHKQISHWLSDYFPLNKLYGLLYLFMVIWTGYSLYRLQIVLNFLR